MKKCYGFLMLFSFLSQLTFSQPKKEKTFEEIRKKYEMKTIDDISAMPDVRIFILKAKDESNFSKLIQGYRDGRQFDLPHKINYADSAIAASIKYGSKDDISNDYLSKGIIYYFYHKNYKLALDQYLKAYGFSKRSYDQYLHHKVIYHLGVVKLHLGYYEEAQEHFDECVAYYGKKTEAKLHFNEKFNRKKAYLNSLHQLTVTCRYLKNYKKSDSLSQLGHDLTLNDDDFALEHSYFLKCRGISKYIKKDYSGAEADLESSLPVIVQRNDFAWASVVYYYLGKINEAQNDTDNAILYYTKIDSIFEVHAFVLPEVYKSYNFLIEHYKDKDVKRQLYYTNQLLKADSLLTKNYAYLSSKLHRDFDRRTLVEEKERLEQVSKKKTVYAQFLAGLVLLILIIFTVRYRKDRTIKKQYLLLQKKLAEQSIAKDDLVIDEAPEYSIRKTFLTDEMAQKITEKLKKFEDEHQFRKKGLTQHSTAVKLGTNSHYLSIYINENKGMNFNRYIAELRINYITNLLNTNNKYLHYTIEALAEECGIAARQNFSSLFYEINGIRPTDYIRNRKKELGLS